MRGNRRTALRFQRQDVDRVGSVAVNKEVAQAALPALQGDAVTAAPGAGFTHPPRAERAAKKLPFSGDERFWDFTIFPKALFPWSPEGGGRPWSAITGTHLFRLAFIGGVHLSALAAPFCFSWEAFQLFAVLSLLASFGMTFSFHRQLAHRAFECPKWIEYAAAYLGCLALEGAPIGWARIHRYHHIHSDKEGDVHSPMDGFWWSHIAFMFDPTTTDKLANFPVPDLSAQEFYRWLDNSAVYATVAVWLPILALYALGGPSFVIWGFSLRAVYVWNVTWAINSIGHIWGYQSYRSGDHSMNNPVLGLLGLGDGWHNNHHAFPRSCRHGLEWYEIDITWYVISFLESVGLAWNLQLPKEKRQKQLAME